MQNECTILVDVQSRKLFEQPVLLRRGFPSRPLPAGPVPGLAQDRVLGRDAGLFVLPDDFDAPLPQDIQEFFE